MKSLLAENCNTFFYYFCFVYGGCGRECEIVMIRFDDQIK